MGILAFAWGRVKEKSSGDILVRQLLWFLLLEDVRRGTISECAIGGVVQLQKLQSRVKEDLYD